MKQRSSSRIEWPLSGVNLIRFQRVHFKGFGENDLTPEVMYLVTDPGFNPTMGVQQKINLCFMEFVHGLGLDFAFPARTIYIAQPPEG
ncbi:hypothetical protein SB861_42635 [Paraburkholderia sp. SIMBA_049]